MSVLDNVSSFQPDKQDRQVVDQMLNVIDFTTDLCLLIETRQGGNSYCAATFTYLMLIASNVSELGFINNEDCQMVWFWYRRLMEEAREMGMNNEDLLGHDPRLTLRDTPEAEFAR